MLCDELRNDRFKTRALLQIKPGEKAVSTESEAGKSRHQSHESDELFDRPRVRDMSIGITRTEDPLEDFDENDFDDEFDDDFEEEVDGPTEDAFDANLDEEYVGGGSEEDDD